MDPIGESYGASPRSAYHTRAVSGPERDQSLQHALDEELISMERAVAGAGMILGGGGCFLTLYTALAISRHLGLLLTVYALFIFGWFALSRFLLGRSVGRRAYPWLNPLVEGSAPLGVVVIDVYTQGALYGATSGVPLLLCGIFSAATVLRLRPIMPVLVSGLAALEYVLISFLLIVPRLPPEAAGLRTVQVDMMLMRSVTMFLGGLMGALVCAVFRNALSKASSGWKSRQLFGKYRVEGELAAGGMGTVHRAVYCPEGGFQRPVALKRIHPHLSTHESFVTAFRNEAEICSRLTHPNIVQVLDFGRIDDTYFLTMEFVDGITLRQAYKACVAAARLPPGRLVALLGREICQGLWFAHHVARDATGARMRVVHRDLNPPNVLISRTGQVKITDFGIARAMGEVRQNLTGKLEGKLGYMAPEQAREQPIDERCDLFAVGIMLWELICGERLFQGENEIDTLLALVNREVPSVGDVRSDVQVALWDRFFTSALARDREGRFATAQAMMEELTALLQAEGLPGPGELESFLAGLPFDGHEDADERRARSTVREKRQGAIPTAG
jgi:serine/threonine-protein kinase